MLYKYTMTGIFAAVHAVKLNSARVTSSYRQTRITSCMIASDSYQSHLPDKRNEQ